MIGNTIVLMMFQRKVPDFVSFHARPVVETGYTYAEGHSYERMDDYKGVCTLTYIEDFGVTISGMRGEYKKEDFLDIFRYIRSKGINFVYVRRKPGRKMPWGHRIKRGGTADAKWIEISIEEVFASE